MERKKGKGILRAHVLAFPFPLQGHINPILQFSKRLASRGVKVTLVTTIFVSKSMNAQTGSSLRFESISDGFDEGGLTEAESPDVYVERFEDVGSKSLAELIGRLDSCGDTATYLVYDSLMPWPLNVAKRLGLACAAFFTQSCAVDVIYYHVQRGLLSTPIQEPAVSIPGLPLVLAIQELPSFVYAPESYPPLLRFNLKQFSNFEKADLLLFNSFDKLEEETVSWMAKQWQIKTIGPTVPSIYLDRRMEEDKDYGLNVFKLNSDDCVKWLSSRETDSVVYVSYGSFATLSEEQIEELAWGLKRSKSHFLWVVRESEDSKLPTKFKEETSGKGLVVTWCPQVEVLAHNSVGCFVTHCGWNSTLEALSLGVPMVAMPQWTDQTTNAKFIVDVWKVGLRVKVDDKGIVHREEIERCINEVMEGEKGTEIRRNTMRWKELAKEAVDYGGSSDKNIEEFVDGLGV